MTRRYGRPVLDDWRPNAVSELAGLPMFEGPHLEAADHERLATALERVRAYLADGSWRTLAEIAAACGCSEAGASARLRQLRAEGHQVDRRNRGRGLHEYRVWGLQKSLSGTIVGG